MDEIKTNNGGTIKQYSYKNGVSYSVYIPPNVTSNTQIFTYTYGSGGPIDWWSGYHGGNFYGVYDALIENGSDSIVVMPSMGWSADWGANTMEIINSIRSDYGISNMNVSGSGFSAGGFAGFDIVMKNIKQNPEIDPQVVFFIDDYSTTYCAPKYKLTEENRALLAKNNTVFLVFAPKWRAEAGYQDYVEAGVNVVLAEPDDCGHVAINGNFFKSGAFNYADGGSLPTEGYTYKVFNKDTGCWEVIDSSKISTIDKLYNYYDIGVLESRVKRLAALSLYDIRSDSRVLNQYLNLIISAIKKTNFLNTSFDSQNFYSTTDMPTSVDSAVKSYFLNVTNVLNKIVDLSDTISNIDTMYQDADQRLSNDINGK